MILLNKAKMTLMLERGLTEKAKVVKELERQWRERSGAGGRKVGTGVAPQALLAPHKISLKFFEVDDITVFFNTFYVDGRYFFERPVSERAELPPHTASRALFCKGDKLASDMF